MYKSIQVDKNTTIYPGRLYDIVVSYTDGTIKTYRRGELNIKREKIGGAYVRRFDKKSLLKKV